MQTYYDAIIIGSGIAGLTAAQQIQTDKSNASILLINGESCQPYKRTKISKNIARGYILNEFALLNNPGLDGIDIEEKTVYKIRPENNFVLFTDGNSATWKTLILATGAKARHRFSIPTPIIRSVSDGLQVRAACEAVDTVAVVGGGVLGVEISEQMVRLGKKVTLFIRGSSIMQKEFNEDCSIWLGAILEEEGVDCRYNCEISRISRTGMHYQVHTATSKETFDYIIECTGSSPDITLAKTAGLKTDKGVIVNECLQTSHPSIFAAGDCCQTGSLIPHLWHQAEDMGMVAGANAAAALQEKPLVKYSYKPRRLKCEVFGTYMFSINPEAHQRANNIQTNVSAGIYQQFGFINNRLCSAIMTGDKLKAKAYEKAVWMGLDPNQVRVKLEVKD